MSKPSKHKTLELILPLFCLTIAAVTILRPGIVYAPQARVTLFLTLALMPAAFFATRVAAHFEMKLPGFALTAGGAIGVVFGTFVLLNVFSRPEQQIAAFEIRDESGAPIPLDTPGTVEMGVSAGGLSVSACAKEHRLFVIFPEQMPTVDIDVVHPSTERRYHGTVSYAGSRVGRIRLGQQLRAEEGGP